jgi:hypothetical protein
MPLSWNEIRTRAVAFSKEWKDAESEQAEAQSFWNDFFNVFGISRKRVAVFEKTVKMVKAGGELKNGRIDAFWKGTLLIEHKSAGEDLERAFEQASDYFSGLPEHDLPRYVLVSDFCRFKLYDLEEQAEEHEFTLADLHKNIRRFAFIAGYKTVDIKPQDPVNVRAAEQLGKLHDRLKASGYTGHPLELLLVRLLFCLFADDTGIFQPTQAFRMWLDERTHQDGSDVGSQLALLFQALNTPEDDRTSTLDEQLADFPYVNGKLFAETIPIAAFDSKMRTALLECCAINWSAISPAIFGALFQSIMDKKARRNLGAHYTSEENILKVIKALFMDDLQNEYQQAHGNPKKLFALHKKLRGLRIFDPACGCGNFLVIAYRELRLLELEILRATHKKQQMLDVHHQIQLDVDQFFGIEIEEFPAQIAQVALWLIDHQMNLRVSEEFGTYFARIPLRSTPHVHTGNALQMDWADVVPASLCSYVLGNPPFVGKKEQNADQKADLEPLLTSIPGSGVLDYVSGWYIKAARYLKGTSVRCAFVSTNSITQGEQVGVLWRWLLAADIRIHFAHRTFQWINEAPGMAAVQCVIIGFGIGASAKRTLFEYADPRGDPQAVHASNINPYLADAPDVLLDSRKAPLFAAPPLNYGSFALDDGHFTISAEDRKAILAESPGAVAFLRKFVGGEELLYDVPRWCLWLKDASPKELHGLSAVMKRVKAVQEWRKNSKRDATKKLAATPTLFAEVRQPSGAYVAIPTLSSEKRSYIPMAFLGADIVASNQVYVLPDATFYHFGVLHSAMHMAWIRYVCGRLESRYRYSASIVYNNFPWPDEPPDALRKKVEAAAQAVLEARKGHSKASLADLYDPLLMPADLQKAHRALDAAVDSSYGLKGAKTDAERVAFLFDRYNQREQPLLSQPAKQQKKKSA